MSFYGTKSVSTHFYDGRTASERSPNDLCAAQECWARGISANCMPSAVEFGCLLCRGARGVPINKARAEELFQKVKSSTDYHAQLHLSQRFYHGACGIEVDRKRAASLLNQDGRRRFREITLVLQGRAMMRDIAKCNATTVKHIKSLFQSAATSDSSLGWAELGLLYHYGAPGIPRDARTAKEYFERIAELRNVSKKYHNEGHVSPRNRVFELYLGNLLAFGGDGVEPKFATAAALLKEAAQVFPQATVLIEFLCERHRPPEIKTSSRGTATALYSEGALQLWRHIFYFSNNMTRNAPKNVSKFRWNTYTNVFANYNYAQTSPLEYSHTKNPLPEQMIVAIINSVDIITLFCVALMLKYGADPFPKDTNAARRLFQRASDLGHEQAKEQLKELPQPPSKSPLEDALSLVLAMPNYLSTEFLRTYVRAEHVTSAISLICGHNLVLLSLRGGILSKSMFGSSITFGGAWYFRDNLYHPASKLVNEDPELLSSIFLHAEKIGIIPDGYVFKVNLFNRRDAASTSQSIVTTFTNLSHKVFSINKRLCNMEENVALLEKDVTKLFDGIQYLEKRQEDNEQSISNLSQSLTDLHGLLQKQEHRMMYAGLAKCAISLLPIIGCSLSQIVDLGTVLTAICTSEEVMSYTTEGSNALIDNIASVDVSNFRVASAVFSDNAIGKLERTAKKNVVESVENSEFRSLKYLQDALNKQVARVGQENRNAELVDIVRSPWSEPLVPSSSTTVRPSSIHLETPGQSTESFYDYLITSNVVEHYDGQLDPPVALKQINILLKNEKLETVSESKFDDVFQKTFKGGDMVDKRLFVEIHQHLRNEYQHQLKLDEIKSRCESYVDRKFHDNTDLSLDSAVHYLSMFYKILVDERFVYEILDSVGPNNAFRHAIFSLQACSETVSRATFVTAAMNLVGNRLR